MAITILTTNENGANSLIDINANFADLDTTKADLVSPVFTGTPVLPTGTTGITQSASNNSTKIATTAYVDTAINTTPSGGMFSRLSDAASNTQIIPHGLGVTPRKIKIEGFCHRGDYFYISKGIYINSVVSTIYGYYYSGGSGSNYSSSANIISMYQYNGATDGQTATITVNATNIILTWTKQGSPASNTMQFLCSSADKCTLIALGNSCGSCVNSK